MEAEVEGRWEERWKEKGERTREGVGGEVEWKGGG